jgi:uncharacterized protein YlzI (FlbEa/FlbD family)
MNIKLINGLKKVSILKLKAREMVEKVKTCQNW